MKLDTSSYYPASPLDEEPDEDVFIETEEPETQQLQVETGGDNTFERIADGVANVLSWLFMPLLMPAYGVLIAFSLSILAFTPFSVKTVFFLVTLAFTLVVPMLLVLLLKRVGLVHDVGLNGREERLIPYIISMVSIAGTGAFMWYKGAPMWLVMFFAGGAVAALVNMLVNLRWKISAHAAGIAGVVALLIRIIRDGFPQEEAFVWLLVAIGLSGLLGTARVWLGRHTVWQVIAGYAVGFTSVFLLTLVR